MDGPRQGRRVRGKAWGWALVVLAATGAARAADLETRDLVLSVDGKRAGDVHMTIHRQDDGVTQVSCDTDVDVRILIVRYQYRYRGREIWKDGRLQRFSSTCNDNGKAYTLAAEPSADGLRIQVNGKDHTTRAEAWVKTYWQLPPAQVRNQTLTLFDGDSGADHTGTLQYLGVQQVAVAGTLVNTAHYRITGGVQVDLWYDGQDRLVRQEWEEENKRILLELANLSRQKP